MNVGTGKSSTILHEFGHHIEFRNKKVAKRIKTWRKQREAGYTKQKISPWFDNDEVGFEDSWAERYTGRVYRGDVTEILSMGVETFGNTSRMTTVLKGDPDHMRMMWAILRGY